MAPSAAPCRGAPRGRAARRGLAASAIATAGLRAAGGDRWRAAWAAGAAPPRRAPGSGRGVVASPPLTAVAPPWPPAPAPAPPAPAPPPLASARAALCGLRGPAAAAALPGALATTVALAAAAAPKRRRRRKDASASKDGFQKGQGSVGIANDAAVAMLPDQDSRMKKRMKLQELKKQLKAADEEAQDADAILRKGEDPSFFVAPYIWIQVSHLVILGVALGALAFGDSDEGVEFVLFDFQGKLFSALQVGFTYVFSINVALAAFLFYEEYSSGPGRLLEAAGWASKALFLGGVASWQRTGRLEKEKEAQSRKAMLAKEPDRGQDPIQL